MKTLFVTSFHQLVPRNILQTPILDGLLRRGDVRVVLAVPDGPKKAYFEKRFSDRMIVVGIRLGGGTRSLRDRIMGRLMYPLVDTASLRILYRGRLENHRRVPHYYLYYLPLRTIGKSRRVRRFFRWLDSLLSSPTRFLDVVRRYRPDLIFSTDVMDKYDVELIHYARKEKIPVVGMVRSWDNLTKFGLLRAIPDHLLVWNALVRKEAIRYQDVPPERIVTVGIPHYDWYTHGARTPRDVFLRSLGADPSRKVILFSPVGIPRLYSPDADQYILELLQCLDATLIVRLPPTNPVLLENYTAPSSVVFDKPGVVFGTSTQLIDAILTPEDDHRFADELFYSDVVVCGPTTVAIDAAVFDRPTVLINFDQHPGRPFLDDAAESYQSIHMQYVVQSGGARLVQNQEELLQEIRAYLANPDRDRALRKHLKEEQGWRCDGQSSERVSEFLWGLLKR